MEDDLKKYLNDHRAFFENEKPSVDLWSKIEEDLKPDQKRKSIFPLLKIAASVLIIMSVGYIGYNTLNQEDPILADSKNDPIESEFKNQMSAVSSDYEEVENYYSSQVNLQMNKLNDYEVDEDLIQEVENLKSEFESLKVEMGKGADQSMVVEAMINNYRLRLMLLEDLLEAVEDTEESKKIEYERDI